MLGLINRALQRFVEDTRGADFWAEVAETAQPGLTGFEAMLDYDDALAGAVLAALAARTGTPPDMLLEDLGTWLVSHPSTESLRRLLRFGGDSFAEFLHSLEDLPDRARLAVPELVLPRIDVAERATGCFILDTGPGLPGYGQVLLGLVRAMADDYGALALAELEPGPDGRDQIAVSVAEAGFAAGRSFDLALRRAGA